MGSAAPVLTDPVDLSVDPAAGVRGEVAAGVRRFGGFLLVEEPHGGLARNGHNTLATDPPEGW